MKKRFLSMALALCMVFGSAAVLPEGIFADSAGISASAAVNRRVVGSSPTGGAIKSP